MKTFQEFILIAEAVYDKDVMGSSQITKMGDGGRIGRERKKTTPEKRRMKRVGGGKVEPVDYKPRKDIGQQKTAAERQQQPEKERGSKEVAQSYAEKVKAERRAAAKARAAAKKSGEAAPAARQRSKDVEKQATQLLSKKAAPKPTATPSDSRFSSSRKPEEHMIKGKYTKDEKKKLVRAGKRLHRDIVKGVEKPASHYQP